ncbi:YfcE family phosphodiesterase [Halorubrum sp. JWXQ-INN 858]|uniref:metallophosphoesterase n=1 Tax=Halorubrum sp. JWXQ-INN 858 TaxID=2690782 RepID=UPI00135A7AC1|nr:metallophosphoesterase [Halorubrum sp. JWXQ-INN 858]MWV63862.1 YfcE family phosphodiesterase [Halorubrum sp. JWXQ-INN 858]
MHIGIVSDTHDDLDAVDAAVALFEREGVDAVVHCGDFVAPFSVTPFDREFDFYAVRGNNDGEWNVQSTVASFGEYLGEAGTLSFERPSGSDGENGEAGEVGESDNGGNDAAVENPDAIDVAVVHGTSGVVVDALVDCGDYDYVFCGHTHAHGVEERNGTVRVNPGGLPIPVPGADDVFRVATLDTAEDGAEAVTHHTVAE